MNKFLTAITRWALAVLLLPLLWAALRQLVLIGGHLSDAGVSTWWRYAAGALTYLLLERFAKKPFWLYVVGHELTHAISGLMSGAEVYSFKATSRGGEVRLSKSNTFIALSPYVIPLYAVFLIGVYALVKVFWPRPEATWVFQFLLGAAIAFHISLTISAFHGHQTDLKVVGFFLSGVLIAVGNSLILGVLGVTLFARTPTMKQYAIGVAGESATIWKKGFFVMKDEIKKQYEKSTQNRLAKVN